MGRSIWVAFDQRQVSFLPGRGRLARALACGPELLILDEALAGLDTINHARLVKLLRGIRAREKLALLFMAHDPKLIRLLCRREAVPENGRLRLEPDAIAHGN